MMTADSLGHWTTRLRRVWGGTMVAALSFWLFQGDFYWRSPLSADFQHLLMLGSAFLFLVLLTLYLVLLHNPRGRLPAGLRLRASGADRLVLGASLALGLFALLSDLRGLAFFGDAYRWRLYELRSALLFGCMLFLAAPDHGLSEARKRFPPSTGRVFFLVLGVFVLVAGSLSAFLTPVGATERTLFGKALSVVFILCMALFVLWVARHRPQREGHCRVCDYDLTGNVSGRCPECGTPIAAGTEAAAAPGPAEVKSTE